jgi:hypothetical protein
MKDKARITEEVDVLFGVASEASRAERKSALRDPALWIEQIIEVAFGVVKTACVALAIALAVMWSIGCPQRLAVALGLFPALALAALNPRRLFWRNLFRMRADTAFDLALRNHR